MFEAPELLASYAAGIRQVSEAVSTSLFVHRILPIEGPGILVVDGGEPPPEHASVETAMQAATAHADSRSWSVSDGLSYVRSSDPHSVLIPIHPKSLLDEPIGWLGLRLTPSPADVGERLATKDLTTALKGLSLESLAGQSLLRAELSGLRGKTALRGALCDAVATLGERSPAPPLGKWLSSDLVILADGRGGGISRRSANLLGIPETTFRRLLKKARNEQARGVAQRPDAWTPVQASLGSFLDAAGAEARRDCLVAAESLLLQAIREQFPSLDAMGAALLGVTLPTYRKRSATSLR